MGFVQRGRVDNRFASGDSSGNHRTVGDGANDVGMQAIDQVEPLRLMVAVAEHSHQCFAQVARTACNENSHA